MLGIFEQVLAIALKLTPVHRIVLEYLLLRGISERIHIKMLPVSVGGSFYGSLFVKLS